MTSDNILVSAIIVNYKSGAYAADCVASLLKQDVAGLEIIVVDNASGDDSVATLRSTCGDSIHLIESRENLGFGRANNLAAAQSRGKWLLLINPDTQLLAPETVSTLVAFMEANPQIGIAGPEIHEPSKHKFVLPRKYYPSEKKLKYTASLKSLPGRHAWILGACMLIEKSVFERIGGFDSDFFLYGEDTDICLRVRQLGYEVGYCEDAKITHVGGASEQSASTLDKYLRKKRGFYLFCRKHYDNRDVLHIARTALISAFLENVKIAAGRLIGQISPQAFKQRKQRLEASKLAAREILKAGV